MHPDERRDALVAAFLELAHRQGRTPTTSEIAAEAAVAEGTIFRAFPTKEALLREAVAAAFCPAPVRRRVAAIDRSQPLRERLVDLTGILQTRFTEVFGLMGALGLTEPPERGPHAACYPAGRHLRGEPAGNGRGGGDGRGGSDVDTDVDTERGACARLRDDDPHEPLLATIHELLSGDTDHLRLPGPQVIHRLRLLTFSGSHPGISDGQVLTPEEIVDTVLFGVMRHPACPAPGESVTRVPTMAPVTPRPTRRRT